MAGTKAPTVGATDSLGVRASDKVPFVSELVSVPERFPSGECRFISVCALSSERRSGAEIAAP